MNKSCNLSLKNDRRGFTIYLMMLVMFLLLFSGFMSQSSEILALAQFQSRLIKAEGQVKPGHTWYLDQLLGPSLQK
ncbi:MAG TPA: hypothetical protein DCG57_17645 [Candidatus Riflebacteria bacterium]|jgi:hypothetical protein|nr:MAG: hypothetical protein CVV41_21580 [Candidatus Riflebacteria bacterium HGW-Riflebacteria-1]HAE40433.1 hypothetical protein [Candidatus Riflebacteria bacterium]